MAFTDNSEYLRSAALRVRNHDPAARSALYEELANINEGLAEIHDLMTLLLDQRAGPVE